MEIFSMANQKACAEKWRIFISTRFLPHFWSDLKARFWAIVLSVITAALILFAQIYYGVIRDAIRGRVLSILWPYAVLMVAFTVYHLARTPWLISNEQVEVIAALNKAVSDLESTTTSLKSTISEKDAEIRALKQPRRSAAEQHNYDKAKAFLNKRGPKFVEALRHLHTHGDLTYSSVGVTMVTIWPSRMDRNEAISIYDACIGEGLVTMQEIPGVLPARKIFIAPGMTNVLSELLYSESV